MYLDLQALKIDTCHPRKRLLLTSRTTNANCEAGQLWVQNCPCSSASAVMAHALPRVRAVEYHLAQPRACPPVFLLNYRVAPQASPFDTRTIYASWPSIITPSEPYQDPTCSLCLLLHASAGVRLPLTRVTSGASNDQR
jgi:hypothetical protein